MAEPGELEKPIELEQSIKLKEPGEPDRFDCYVDLPDDIEDGEIDESANVELTPVTLIDNGATAQALEESDKDLANQLIEAVKTNNLVEVKRISNEKTFDNIINFPDETGLTPICLAIKYVPDSMFGYIDALKGIFDILLENKKINIYYINPVDGTVNTPVDLVLNNRTGLGGTEEVFKLKMLERVTLTKNPEKTSGFSILMQNIFRINTWTIDKWWVFVISPIERIFGFAARQIQGAAGCPVDRKTKRIRLTKRIQGQAGIGVRFIKGGITQDVKTRVVYKNTSMAPGGQSNIERITKIDDFNPFRIGYKTRDDVRRQGAVATGGADNPSRVDNFNQYNKAYLNEQLNLVIEKEFTVEEVKIFDANMLQILKTILYYKWCNAYRAFFEQYNEIYGTKHGGKKRKMTNRKRKEYRKKKISKKNILQKHQNKSHKRKNVKNKITIRR